MNVILFDLGRTLETDDVLLPGAADMLIVVAALRDASGKPLGMGLVSDFTMPPTPADIPEIRKQYIAILDRLRIRNFFEPLDRGVTLSTDVGVFKPDKRIFRAALDKFEAGLPFVAAMFVTENPEHVAAATALGMRGVHFKGPGQASGEIDKLLDLVPLVRQFIAPQA
jgi:FMN phosphatase YigB (HAD superfamily)